MLNFGYENSRIGTYPFGFSRRLGGFPTGGLEALYSQELETKNLLRYSEAFDNAAWNVFNGTLARTTEVTDPFGGNNAWITEASTTATGVTVRQIVNMIAGRTYTISFYLRGKGSTIGKLGSVLAIGNAVNNAGNTVTLTDSWQRVTYTFTAIASDTGDIRVTNPGSSFAVGDQVYMAAAMWSEGSVALPYVPTTNKQALYDYSGKGRHGHLGSVGSAFIAPVGEKHLSLPGTNGNSASATYSGMTTYTGDMDWTIKVNTPAGDGRFHMLFGCVGGQDYLGVNPSGVLEWGINATYRNSTVTLQSLGLANTDMWLRSTWRASDGRIQHFYSLDGNTWTQIGADVTSATSRTANANPRRIGAYGGNELVLNGRIFQAQIREGIDGTLVADFNPARDAHGDVSRFVSSTTGEAWTINQATATDTNDPVWTGEGLLLDGADDYVTLPRISALEGNPDFSVMLAARAETTGTGDNIAWSYGSPSNNQAVSLGAGYVADRHSASVYGSDFNFGEHVPNLPYVASWSKSGVTREVHLNGEVLASDTIPATAITWGTHRLGRTPGASAVYFDGIIGPTAIYSTALNAAQVSQAYQATLALGWEPTPGEFVEDSLEALYTMDVERRNLQPYSTPINVDQDSSTAGVTFEDFPTGIDEDFGPKLVGTAGGTEYHYAANRLIKAGTYTLSHVVRLLDGSEPLIAGLDGIRQATHITPNWFGSTSVCDGKEHIGNGWWRLWKTITLAADANSAFGPINYPDNLPATFYTAQYQINEGSTALPYVPTTNKQALYDYSGKGRHATRGSAGSAFICPVGEKHLSLPGTAGNSALSDFVTIPAASSFSFTFDVDHDRVAGDNQMIVETEPRWFGLAIQGGPQYDLFVRDDTGNQTTFDLSTPTTGRNRLRIEWDHDNGSGIQEARIYDDETDTLLATDTKAQTAGALFTDDVVVRLGRLSTLWPFDGRFYSVSVSANGTLVADFNPDRDAHGDVSRFTSSTTGEVWTINQASAADTNDPTWTGEGGDFDGTDDTVHLPNFPISTWGGLTQSLATVPENSAQTALLSALQITSGEDIRIELNGGTWQWKVDDGVIQGTVAGSPAVADTPIFLSGTYEPGIAAFYEDGVLVDTTAVNINMASSSDANHYLASRAGSSLFYAGIHSTYSLYSGVLSGRQIAQNYRAARLLLADRSVSI